MKGSVNENQHSLKSRYPVGMTSVTFREKTISEIVDIACAAGLSHIEWGADRHVPPHDEAAAGEAVSLMERHGLSCSSYGSYYRIGDGDTAAFRQICETAEMLGASVVRTWLGRAGSGETPPEKRESLLAETRCLADIAAGYSLTLAFEFHGGTLNDNGEASAAFYGRAAGTTSKPIGSRLPSGTARKICAQSCRGFARCMCSTGTANTGVTL